MVHRKFELKFAWLVVFWAGVSLLSFSQESFAQESFAEESFAQEPITIERALEIAEENNPLMITSKLNLERTRFSLEALRASLKSQFSLNLDPSGYSQTRRFDERLSQWYTNKTIGTGGTFRVQQPILWTDGTITLINRFGWQDNLSIVEGVENRNKAFTNNLNLRLDQPIFTYNRQKMDLKELEFSFENAGISYALQRLTTESRITDQFYDVYLAQENLEISRNEFENAKLNYEIIKSKVEADLSAREELFQAEVNLATSESAIQQRIVNLENAKDALKQTLGMPLANDISVTADIDVHLMSIDAERAIQNGLASRMELRQREIAIAQADLQMIETKALNEFKGNLSLQIGILGDHERFTNMYDNPTQNPQITISLAVPIFDWGEKKARVKAQQTQQTIAKLNYENEKIDIELEIRKTLRNLENLSNRIGIAEKTVRNAQLTYDLNQIRYREGDITGMQINQFQAQLSSAKITLVESKIDYKTQMLNLKIASLYDFEKDEAIVPVKEATYTGTR